MLVAADDDGNNYMTEDEMAEAKHKADMESLVSWGRAHWCYLANMIDPG